MTRSYILRDSSNDEWDVYDKATDELLGSFSTLLDAELFAIALPDEVEP